MRMLCVSSCVNFSQILRGKGFNVAKRPLFSGFVREEVARLWLRGSSTVFTYKNAFFRARGAARVFLVFERTFWRIARPQQRVIVFRSTNTLLGCYVTQ